MKHARALFYTAAIFNFLAVLLLLPATGIATILGLTPAPDNGVFNQIALLAIFGFGAGYWMVGRDPSENRAVVVLGLFLKLGVVAIAAFHFVAGTANLNLFALVSGDLLFALAFAGFLAAPTAQPQRKK
ncbi:MAG: hypothetical protein V4508_05930 [Pseudomonadota bacterium]